jgi:cell division protein FtsI/penicillin-binding protein 2
MKKFSIIMIMAILLAACAPEATPEPTASIEPTNTLPSELPDPLVETTMVPDVDAAVASFLEFWKQDDYSSMYNMLTSVSKDALTYEEFEKKANDFSVNLTLQEVNYTILSSLVRPTSAQVSYRVIYTTTLIDTLTREMVINLSLENGVWRMQWDDGLLMPELSGGNTLYLNITTPARGNIYDVNGEALVTEAEVVSLGIAPISIEDGNFSATVSRLSVLTEKSQKDIYDLLDEYGYDYPYIPIGEALAQDVTDQEYQISSLEGFVQSWYDSRFYYDGGVAPHVTGYVQPIYPEDVLYYQRLGYRFDDYVGATGLEKWGEDYLIGTRGVELYVLSPNGDIVTRLYRQDPSPSQSIYTTFDAEFQQRVERAISGFNGAVVVLERDTGRVLAMASNPTFNPNLFAPNNENDMERFEVANDGNRPQLNRATQGGYPLGSVFKIITMAAALESDRFTEESMYDCQYEFTELAGYVGEDWTKAKEIPPSGELTLPEGLMRSCNPWFYHIGLDLYRNGYPRAVTDMALGFGLGEATGIGQVAEDEGAMPYPQNDGDAVQQGIGQGTMLVTPLQVARFIAAIGNGGTLYRPQVVEKISTIGEDPSYVFEPEVQGTLPISDENLAIIQEAMRTVINNPRGTAYSKFMGINVPLYGKTGTAQNPSGDAHAWFAGYTDTKNSSLPNIAVVVIAENAGDGSAVGAPIFRRVISQYYGIDIQLYPWESMMNVTRTPTPTEEGQ